MNASMSDGFTLFTKQFPQTAQAHMEFVRAKAAESALDAKTTHLAYIGVLCAAGLTSGLPFHIQLARQSGASHEEILSACLVGLQAVGLIVMDGYEVANRTLDQEPHE